MKISAVRPDLAFLDNNVPDIELETTDYLYLRNAEVTGYDLTYSFNIRLSPEEFKAVINAE